MLIPRINSAWGYTSNAPAWDNIPSGQYPANERYGSNSHLPANPGQNKTHGPALYCQQQPYQYTHGQGQGQGVGYCQPYQSSHAPMLASAGGCQGGGFGGAHGGSQGAVYATAGGGRGDGGGSMFCVSK